MQTNNIYAKKTYDVIRYQPNSQNHTQNAFEWNLNKNKRTYQFYRIFENKILFCYLHIFHHFFSFRRNLFHFSFFIVSMRENFALVISCDSFQCDFEQNRLK